MIRRLLIRGAAPCVLVVAVLCGCQGTQVVTGAGGTRLQARDVVRLVYAQTGEPGSATLTYFAGDITPAVRRMMSRFPDVRKALESGSVGLTADGRLALRDAAALRLKPLVDAENMDRDILYSASAAEAGHGSNDQYGDWMPYERETFAREWLEQAPGLWWHRDERGNWRRKAGPSTGADADPK